MTSRQPPRFALALLDSLVDDSEPLAGDLLEEFAAGRSRIWLWLQVLSAVALSLARRPREVRPLRLVDERDRSSPSVYWPPVLARRGVNLTASPVRDIGGLGLVVFAALVTRVMPVAWWFVLGAVGGGVALGVVRVALSRRRLRHHVVAGPSGLFRG